MTKSRFEILIEAGQSAMLRRDGVDLTIYDKQEMLHVCENQWYQTKDGAERAVGRWIKMYLYGLDLEKAS